jgi:hypothetical protein
MISDPHSTSRTTPAGCTRRFRSCLDRSSSVDVDLFEINEAFASSGHPVHTRSGHRPGERQCQRRGDLDGPPGRRLRGPDHPAPGAGAGPPRWRSGLGRAMPGAAGRARPCCCTSQPDPTHTPVRTGEELRDGRHDRPGSPGHRRLRGIGAAICEQLAARGVTMGRRLLAEQGSRGPVPPGPPRLQRASRQHRLQRGLRASDPAVPRRRRRA